MVISAHFRDAGPNAVKAVEELINLSVDSNIPVQISHLGSCAAVGYMKEALLIIEKAKNKGVQVDTDCYPYVAFSTSIGSAVFDDGWREKMGKSYEDIILIEEPYRGVACNSKLFHEVRKNHPDMYVVASVMNEDEVIMALKAPYMMVASDGTYNKGQGHPRGAGTFPRVLGRYVREMNEISLLDALKKMTIYPARKLGINSKGLIKETMDADIVIFDPDKIIDQASFENPAVPPLGIDYVIVNGTIAVDHNHIVASRAGRFVKKSELSR